MQVAQFPASAANSLIEGYCGDFVSLAAILAQTLEQVSMRGIAFDASRPSLERIERGMRELASAIQELLARGKVTTHFDSLLGTATANAPAPPAPAPAPAPAAPTAPPPPRWLGDTGPGPKPFAPPGKAAPAEARPPHTRPHPFGGKPIAVPPQPSPPARPARRVEPPPLPPSHAPAPSAPQAASAPPAPSAPPVPSAPEVPDAPEVVAAKSGTEVLRGTNQSMPVLSVFQFLGRMRKTGTMIVYRADETLAFEFVNGCVQFTASDRCPVDERLGELLVELGFCTRDALAPALAKVGVSSSERLGQLVVQQGIVSNGQVLEALERQVHRRFHRVCNGEDVHYEFEEGVCVPGDGRIRITPMELAYEQKRIER